ncbi:MAG: hypothetical protein SGI90_01985 [Candidatus Eisenbacteria bacterium]|nr:hypothetical protein [Candidatus Eisenbacteria bacterium]
MTLRQSVRAALIGAALLISANPAKAAEPCFDVRVEYLGRTYYGLISGVQYWTWNYKVIGETCINRGLSHWVLGLCQNYWGSVFNISTSSVDSSDPANGTTSTYTTAVGVDPPTGQSGVKWNSGGGNQLDKANEYDTFSFVSPGQENLMGVSWAAKGATLIEHGTTIGPSCTPVPVATTTWTNVKSRFGN